MSPDDEFYHDNEFDDDADNSHAFDHFDDNQYADDNEDHQDMLPHKAGANDDVETDIVDFDSAGMRYSYSEYSHIYI